MKFFFHAIILLFFSSFQKIIFTTIFSFSLCFCHQPCTLRKESLTSAESCVRRPSRSGERTERTTDRLQSEFLREFLMLIFSPSLSELENKMICWCLEKFQTRPIIYACITTRGQCFVVISKMQYSAYLCGITCLTSECSSSYSFFVFINVISRFFHVLFLQSLG